MRTHGAPPEPVSLGRAIIDTASGVVEIGRMLERNFRVAALEAEETEPFENTTT